MKILQNIHSAIVSIILKLKHLWSSYRFRTKDLYWIIPSGIAFIAIILLLLAPVFVKTYLHNKIDKIEKEKNITITIGDMSVRRYSELTIEDVSIIQNNSRDTFLLLTNLKCEIALFRHGRFHPHAVDIYLDKLSLNFIKEKGISNYAFLEPQKKVKAKKQETDYPKKINHYLDLLIRVFPKDLHSKSITIVAKMDSIRTDYHMKNIKIDEKQLTGTIEVQNGFSGSKWNIRGKVDAEKNYFAGILALDEGADKVGKFPFIEKMFKIDLAFHELAFSLDVKNQDVDNATFSVGGRIDNCQFYHPKIADQTVKIDSASFALDVAINPGSIVIDSTSVMLLNGFKVHPYIRYEKKKNVHFVFAIKERNFNAATFFRAMPPELFQVISQMSVSGNMNFSLLFDCDFAKVDDLTFDFDISSRNLSFLDGSSTLITRFNAPFEYLFYEGGVPVRSIMVGPENPSFCNFDKIPPMLKFAILASEDASFFRHNGFLKSSIQDAMVTNIKRGKFSRGGSTITMQLVKNLFLNRKKVASRKFEEMVLTWLIENNNLISKDRMFEIYVNIIEWGPYVHGINEAAAFYFDKKPEELTFGECVYLATLIRSPKKYAWTLDSFGNVTESRRSEMRFVAQRMLEKEMIGEAQFATFNSFVTTRIDEAKLEEVKRVREENRSNIMEKTELDQ